MSLKIVRDLLNSHLQSFLSLDTMGTFGGFEYTWGSVELTWASADTEIPGVATPVPVAWENVDFKPNPVLTHFRVNFIPANSVSTARFKSAMIRESGIYQIDVYTPLNKGTFANDILSNALRVHFKRGTSLVKDGYNRVYMPETPRVSFSRREDPFYRTSIDVSWMAHFAQP